jgi:lipoprotein-anchoring transpeptidase ErfK/SrfK
MFSPARFALACAFTLMIAAPADASLLITVDKTKQRMIVARDDQPIYDWPVSSGQRGYDTPSGVYQPFRMEKDHFSREWDDAPMPYSIFFTQEGHAIHGSSHVKNLGKPASHGCVRISPQNAAILWKLVREEKMANVRVVLTGEIPGGPGEKAPPRGTDPYGDDDMVSASTSWAPAGAPRSRAARDPYERYYFGEAARSSNTVSARRARPYYYSEQRPYDRQERPYYSEDRSGFGWIFGR